MFRSIVVGLLLLATQGLAHGHSRVASHTTTHRGDGHWVGVHPHQTSVRKTSHNKHSTRHVRQHHIQVRHHAVPVYPQDSGNLVTVPTAAGISITVDRKLVPQFKGFIDDLVHMGYTPKHIGCWAPYGTHVANSNHYHGGACDFDQTGWGRTNPTMYHVHDLVAKWGLRDGCSFRRPDCGHVDDGTNIRWKHPNSLIARYIDYQTSPVAQVRRPALENFEE